MTAGRCSLSGLVCVLVHSSKVVGEERRGEERRGEERNRERARAREREREREKEREKRTGRGDRWVRVPVDQSRSRFQERRESERERKGEREAMRHASAAIGRGKQAGKVWRRGGGAADGALRVCAKRSGMFVCWRKF